MTTNREQLATMVNERIEDNTVRRITPADVRDALMAIADMAMSEDDVAQAIAAATSGQVTATELNSAIASAVASLTTASHVASAIAAALSDYATTAQLSNGLSGKVSTGTLAAVAASGNYTDLSGRPTIPAAQIQADWTQNTASALDYIKNKPGARAFTSVTITPSTAAAPINGTQLSATRDTFVVYPIDINVTSPLLAGSSGTAYLEYADNAAMSANLVTIPGTNATSGVLNLANLGTVTLVGVIPAGKYRRVRVVANNGSPTFTARPGQEVAL